MENKLLIKLPDVKKICWLKILRRTNFQNGVNGTCVDSSDDFNDVCRRDQIADAETDDGLGSDVEFQRRI